MTTAFSSESVGQYYDEFAATYDEETGGRWNANLHLADLLHGIGQTRAARQILDLGAGTGQTIDAIRAEFPAAAVMAVDASTRMLARLQARHPGVAAVAGDAESFLRGHRGPFDLITSVGMLDLIANLPGVIDLAARRLTPGGDLVFTYEPIIADLGEQGERHNVARGRRLDGSAVSIAKYRWHADEVAGFIGRAAMSVHAHRLLVAFINSTVPVVYAIVWARRSGNPLHDDGSPDP